MPAAAAAAKTADLSCLPPQSLLRAAREGQAGCLCNSPALPQSAPAGPLLIRNMEATGKQSHYEDCADQTQHALCFL